MKKPSVALIGAGAAGSAVAVALYRAGYPIMAVSSRSAESARRCADLVACEYASTDLAAVARCGEIVIISTPDSLIETTCSAIADADGFSAGQLVIHLSGAMSSDALETAANLGADALAFHPAQTMVEPLLGATSLKKAWFCLEGNVSAVERGEVIARDISNKVVVIEKSKKALYHAALSVSSNYLVTLEAVAVEMLVRAGISRQHAIDLLMPLIQGSVDTLADSGLPNALTGPLSRGDVTTIKKHLSAMDSLPREYQLIYRAMGAEALKVATAKGRMAEGSEVTIEQLLDRPLS